MSSGNLLRKQVISEIKKKHLIISIMLLLSFIYLATIFLLGDAGFLRYRVLATKRAQIEREANELMRENQHMKSHLKSLKENPFYAEKYAREEFGLARPDEYIFQYDR